MKPVFVDTSGWYDLLFAGAPAHEKIVAFMRRKDAGLVTSTYVLAELVALILSRGDHKTATRVGAHIRSASDVRLEHPDLREENEAWLLFMARPDKRYTLTDCLSFVIMRRLGLDTAIATDQHFRQEGFVTLP